jgi:hypothetical protein
VFGADEFGVEAGAADAGEPEVEAFGVGGAEVVVGDELGLGGGGVEFGEGARPVVGVVGGAGVAALVLVELVEGEVEGGHKKGGILYFIFYIDYFGYLRRRRIAASTPEALTLQIINNQ